MKIGTRTRAAERLSYYHDDNDVDNPRALHTRNLRKVTKKTPVCEHMAGYTCIGGLWPYLFFLSTGRDIKSINRNGEIEAFDVDAHLRLVERGT